MELTNSFVVDVPVDEAWAILTDVETIAPCLPGAQLQEIDGDEYRGIVKVKVGPITAQYRGVATFVERDAVAHRAVIKADGRDTRGQGNANALITAEMSADGPNRTAVTITTDLTVTGKVAQFGRGVMADVSGKLMTQFAENLSTTVLSDRRATAGSPTAAASTTGSPAVNPVPTPAAAASTTTPVPTVTTTAAATANNGAVMTTTAAAPRREVLTAAAAAARTTTARKFDMPEPEPIDLLDAAGTPLLKRLAPFAAVAAVVALLMRLFGGRK